MPVVRSCDIAKVLFVLLVLSTGSSFSWVLAECDEPEVAEARINDTFQGVFASIRDPNSLKVPLTLVPQVFCGDLNGDGLVDYAILGTVQDTADLTRLESLEFYKPLSKNMSIARYPPRLNGKESLAYKRSPVLFVLLSHRLPEGRSRYRGLAIVDFLGLDATRMQPMYNPIPNVGYPDATSTTAAPRLKGVAIAFINPKGDGSLLYLDGTIFRWYPVGRP